MAEYIDSEPMIEKMQELIDNVSHNFPKATETELIILKGKYEAFIEYIKEQPVADVQPVKHGRWVKCGKLEGKIVMKCSECEQGITAMFAPKYHYCPNCGAKMSNE